MGPVSVCCALVAGTGGNRTDEIDFLKVCQLGKALTGCWGRVHRGRPVMVGGGQQVRRFCDDGDGGADGGCSVRPSTWVGLEGLLSTRLWVG